MSSLRLIVIFCLAQVLSLAAFGSFPALMPLFFDIWQLSSSEAGWINGVYFAAYMAAVPVLVSLTDRLDPRHIFVLSAGLTAVALLAFAFLAEGFWSALVLRALAGVGLAGTYMPGLKALADLMPERNNTRAVAFYTACFSIGSAFSFLAIGVLEPRLGWQATFAILAIGPLIAGLAVFALTPAIRPAADPHDRHLLDFRPILGNRRAMAYIIAYAAHNWELFALRSWLVAFLFYAQSLQPEGAIGADWNTATLAALVIMLGLPASVLGNEASGRFGRRRVVMVIMCASALLAAVFGFSAFLPIPLLVALCLFYGITVTADSSSITAGAIANAVRGQRGATMAVHSFIGFAGASLGPVAFGWVLDVAGGQESSTAWGLAFALSGLAVAVGPLALWLVGARRVSGSRTG